MAKVQCLLLALCLPARAGCASTLQDLKASPRETGTFKVSQPYPLVLSTVENAMMRCFRGGTNVSHFHAAATETRKGEAAVVEMIQDGLSRRVLMAVDLRAATDGTQVSYFVHRGFNVFVTYRSIVMGWAEGTGTLCGTLWE
jgi:hypothetical protein